MVSLTFCHPHMTEGERSIVQSGFIKALPENVLFRLMRIGVMSPKGIT